MTSTIGAALCRFPALQVATPRLLVRELLVDDAERVAEIFADRQAQLWLPVPRDYDVAAGYAWCSDLAVDRRDRGDGDHLGLVRRADDQLVGCLWIKNADSTDRVAELAFAIAAECRGFGMAAEALDAVALSLLLEYGFARVQLRIAAGNRAARGVAQKAGFTFEGVLRNAGRLYNGRVDLEMWSLVLADIDL